MIAPRDAVQYMLRLPPGLRAKIKRMADKNGHSMNTEIIFALTESVEAASRLERLGRRVEQLEKLIRER